MSERPPRPRLSDIVSRDPEDEDGAPCWRGTRVQVATLRDALRAGATVDDYLLGHPAVARWQVEALLDWILTVLASAADTSPEEPALGGARDNRDAADALRAWGGRRGLDARRIDDPEWPGT